MTEHRKRVRHFHEPGDVHELTFSCYQRKPLLTNDERRRLLAESIDRAVARYALRLIAFVFMLEHVHLLVLPLGTQPDLPGFLKAVKQPCSFRIKQRLMADRDPLLGRLTVRERPGVTCFRFWQEGPEYDRNLPREGSVLASIDYLHLNPVRRGLCERAIEWKWSSARHFVLPAEAADPDLPTVHGLPAEFFGGRKRR